MCIRRFCTFLILLLPLWSCSFNYGETTTTDDSQPDIVMTGVEYVRVRDGNPVVRFTAKSAERYESRQTMALENFSFEQFESRGESVNAVGTAGIANVELESGNIHMTGGVRIEVDSEDITIETRLLDWQDKDRLLSGGELDQVDIVRSDGTRFTGWGFSADARRRTWVFSGGVEGTYIDEDDESVDGTSADGTSVNGMSDETSGEPAGAIKMGGDKTKTVKPSGSKAGDSAQENLTDILEAAEK